MDSFSQRMLDSIERRYETYQLSTSTTGVKMANSDDCERNELCSGEKENLTMANMQYHAFHQTDFENNDTDDNVSVLTERNKEENERNVCHNGNVSPNQRPETIYANSNVIKRNGTMDSSFNNNAIPVGRKPALPPKPSSRAQTNTSKTKQFVQTACAAIVPLLKSPPAKRDPAEMSLKERLAMFEKNKGSALMPKAPLGMSVPVKQKHKQTNNDQAKAPLLYGTIRSVSCVQRSNSKCSSASSDSFTEKVHMRLESEHQRELHVGQEQHQLPEPMQRQKAMQSLYNGNNDHQNLTASQEYVETEIVLNALTTPEDTNQLFDATSTCVTKPSPTQRRSPPPPVPLKSKDTRVTSIPNNTTVSIEPESHVEADCTVNNKRRSGTVEIPIDNRLHIQNNDVKRAKPNNYATVVHTKLYGDLTPIVTTVAPCKRPDETIGLNDLHPNEPKPNDSYQPQQHQSKDEDSFTFDSVLNSSGNLSFDFPSKRKLEEFCDLERDDVSMDNQTFDAEEMDTASTDDCQTQASASSTMKLCEAPTEPNDREVLDSSITEPGELKRTLSSYRREKSNNTLQTRKIFYPSSNRNTLTTTCEESIDDEWFESERVQVDAKIKQLLNDISIQKHHMMQASHALNICASTFEFAGSTESVVAEWKLLVTTLSHEVALAELNRLRTQKYVRRPDAAQDSGRLTISEIALPLHQQYVSKLATDAVWGHQLVCILRLNDSEQIVSTKTIPTLPGLLSVKFTDAIQIKNIFSDFHATLDIYGMVSHRENLPHDVKTPSKPKKFMGFGLLTPKNKKSSEPRPLSTPIQSPANGNAIRKSSFNHIGTIAFTLRDIQRTNWPIAQLSDNSPLNGVISMRISCELTAKVEHQAFLTMFEDVSGFGAWHRRWCQLNGHLLSYWKYPDDMGKIPAIGHIDLALCRQEIISSAPRETCTRMNTIMIEVIRNEYDGEEKMLNIFQKDDVIVQRLLLSCDTKEQKDDWCIQFNRALQIQRTKKINRL